MSARGLTYDYCTYFNLLKPFATSLGRHKTIHIFRPCNFSLQTYLFAGHHSCSNENPKPEEQETHQGTSSISEDVSLLCKDGQLQEALDMWFVMDRQGFSTDCKTYSRLLQGCITKRALAQGNRVHAHIIQTGFEWSIIVYSNLINMYAKCGNLRDAQQLFEKMPEQDMISWNALISGYAHHGLYEEALKQFFKMQIEGMRPDQFTLASVLSTCANIGNLEKGQQVHGCVIKSGWESQIFVGNALVDMYGKCGKIEAAHLLFDDNQEKDDVSWNALIAGYAQIGYGEEAIQLFCQMQRMGFKIGHFTLGSVLKVCGNVSFSEQGKQVHAYIIKSGHESNVFMISAILDMYAKCGRMDYSQQLFDEVPEQGEVLWNSLITGYAQNGHGEETLKHFYQMQWAGLKANHFTFGSVLKACSSVANPEHGKRIHSFIIKTGFESDILVGSAIVDMYAKCGVTEDARTMFYKMPERNVVTWNTIIAGFCQVVDAEEALNYFCEMQQTGIKPNHFTVSSVLRACTSIASLDYGRVCSEWAG